MPLPLAMKDYVPDACLSNGFDANAPRCGELYFDIRFLFGYNIKYVQPSTRIHNGFGAISASSRLVGGQAADR